MECNTGRVINLSGLPTRFQGLRDHRQPKGKRYAASIEQKGFASLTRKRKIVAIRSFLSFLHQEGDIDTNIANKVVLYFNETTKPSVLTQTECNKLRSACAKNAGVRAIIELLLQTGITLSDLVNLTLNDIQLDEKHHDL